jgi:hypothetical protein
METKIVYQLDALGIYVGQAVADLSPLEDGVWLIPRDCVSTAPPTVPKGKAARWDGRRWKVVESYQGLLAYNTITREAVAITQPGPLAEGYTLDVPGPGQIWKDGQWVDDQATAMANLFASRMAAVNSACQLTIIGGIWSSALGTPHQYATQLEDQLNLTGLILRGIGGGYPCTDETGVRDYLDHSAAQLSQIGDEFTTFKMAALTKANDLKAKLAEALAAHDLVGLTALTWAAQP